MKNGKVWLNNEALTELNITAENADDMAILVTNGSIDGVFCSSGKIQDIHISTEDLAEMIERLDLITETD